MTQYKSIDGLSTRRSKKATSSSMQHKTAAKNSRNTPKKTPQKTTKTTSKNPQTTAATDFLQPVQAFDFDQNSGKLKPSSRPSTSSTKKSKPPKKHKKLKRAAIIIGSIFLLLLIILILWGNAILAKITGDQGNVFDLLFSDNYVTLKTDENGRTNILAFGTSGFDMEGEEYGGIHDGAQLTDSIMVLSLNQETGDLAMLSLPRDLKASPTCTATSKINEIYWCNNMDNNNEQAGAEALMKEVGDILGVEFQYFAHLNWGSLVQIVDTLGGVNVTLDEDISDYYYTGSVYQAGVEYHLSGIEAVALSRARHGTASGDFSRGASQQKILIGLKDQVSQKGLSVTDMVSLAATLGDNLRTNFSVEELKTLAHLLSTFDFNRTRQLSLLEPTPLVTNGSVNGISYVLPVGGAGYYRNIQAFIDKMFSNDPRVYEEPSILVLNGSDQVGLAKEEQSKLEADGYTDITIDDAPVGHYPDRVTLYALSEKPGSKHALEEYYHLTAKSADELPAGIPQTYDFIIILGSNQS